MAYKHELNRLHRAMHKAEKEGYIFSENALPQTPKRITENSVARLKKIKPVDMKVKGQKYDVETNSIITGKEAVKKAKRHAIEKRKETIRIKKQAEAEFWSNPEPTQEPQNKQTDESNNYKQKKPDDRKRPDGGKTIYYNILNEFITRLSAPTPQYTPFGSRRNQLAYETSERERTTLYSLTMKTVYEIGESALGWRLQDSADTAYSLLQYVLYGSDAGAIQSASHELAQIIAGGYVPLADLMDLEDESEYNEDWDEPV